jgi:hypothetical protein
VVERIPDYKAQDNFKASAAAIFSHLVREREPKLLL